MKVSRRVASTYLDSLPYTRYICVRVRIIYSEMLGDERMLDVLRARKCSRVTEASASIFAGIHFRYVQLIAYV